MIDRLNNATGVLASLKSLQGSQRDLSATQQRLSSGLAVASAKDDSARYEAAASMRGETGSLRVVTLSLGRAQSISDTALSGAEQVSKLLIEMKATAAAALSQDLAPDQRQVLDRQLRDQRAQLDAFVRNAAFDDANLLDGSRPAGVTFIADAGAEQSLSLKGRDFRAGGALVTLGPGDHLATIEAATASYEKITQSIETVGRELAAMASENKRIEAHVGFVSRLADVLADGVGRLVDTDLAVDAALIQALQVKQELSSASINIANGAPEALLALFRA